MIPYIAPTMDMLFQQPWTTEAADEEVQRWRNMMTPQLVSKKQIDNGWTTNADSRPYPPNLVKQTLADGLLLPMIVIVPIDLKMDPGVIGRPGPNDQEDLARWLGVALAFEHDKELLNVEPKGSGRGGQTLLYVLSALMEEAAELAWVGQTMPEWAQEQLGDVLNVIRNDDASSYRPWADVQKDLITVLSTFSQYTKHSYRPDDVSSSIVNRLLSLQVLAGLDENIVSDQLFEKLTWLDQNSYSDEEDEEHLKDVRRLIHATWERKLLERVADHPDGHQLMEKSSLGSRRKRFL